MSAGEKKNVKKKQYNKWGLHIKHPSTVDIDELFKSLCDTLQDAELVVCIIMEKKSLYYTVSKKAENALPGTIILV